MYAMDFVSDDPDFVSTMTMTWELAAADAGTRSTSPPTTFPTEFRRRITLPG